LIRQRLLLYIAAGMVAAGCRPRLEPLVPLPLEPASWDSATAWARRTAPASRTTLRLRWRYEDERAQWVGRGTVRIAPPDSLRLDFVGPLGIGSGAGVVLGDSLAWTEPQGSLERLVPAIPMLWAAFGVARPPAAGAMVFTRVREERDGAVRYWRFARGADTLDYVQRSGSAPELEVEWRRNGSVVARSLARYDEHRRPAESRVDFPRGPARIDFVVTGAEPGPFPASLWRRR
jgi:hypothetical protein